MTEAHANKEVKPSTWLVLTPSIIGGVVAIAGIWSGYMVAVSGQRQQQTLEVSKLKLQIIGSTTTFDFRTATMLLEHALKPIDTADSYKVFEKDFKELLATKAPQAPGNYYDISVPTGWFTVGEGLGYVGSLHPATFSELQELVRQFQGLDRFKSSERLIDFYDVQPQDVVNALIGGILPANDKWSYRANLYIAFTLARIRPGWSGTKEQRQSILKLKETKNYEEPTFRRRVDEALANYKG